MFENYALWATGGFFSLMCLVPLLQMANRHWQKRKGFHNFIKNDDEEV